MGEMVKLMGLWKNKTKEGKQYLTGFLGQSKVLIFQNDKKETEKDFDYNVFITQAPPRKRDNGGSSQSTGSQVAPPQDEDAPF